MTEIDRGKRHDISTIDQGLIYLALNYGKARKAERAMKEDGLDPVPASTLDYWRKISHPGRYTQLRDEVEKRRDLNAAERMDALVSRALELEEKILDQAEEKLDKIDARDLPNAFKNLAIGSGVLQDKSDRLKDKPALVTEHRVNVEELERTMRQIQDMAKAMEAEARNVVDADVVEDPREE